MRLPPPPRDISARDRRKPRDGSVELFRCLLMFVIVLHHCCVHGPLTSTWGAKSLFVLTLPAVDGFMAISGWYGIRFSWGKFLCLWALFAYYSVFFYTLRWVMYLLGHTEIAPSFGIGGGWFGGSYLAIMLIAPLINAGLETLSETPKRLWTAWGLYALAVTLDWLPLLNLSGVSVSGWGSHTFNTLLFVYVTLRVFRLAWPSWLTPQRIIIIALALLAVQLLSIPAKALGYAMLGKPPIQNCLYVLSSQGYDMPLTWLCAVFAFLAFRQLRIPVWLTRLATFLGPSMFGIYLLHESKLRAILYQRPELWLNDACPWLTPVGIVLVSAVFCFSVSLAFDLLRRVGLLMISSLFLRRSKQTYDTGIAR